MQTLLYRAEGAAEPPAGAAALPGLMGDWLQPGSAPYEAARRLANTNPRADAKPALIARCAGEDDVRAALRVALDQRLPLAVRSGGHDVLGASSCEGGLVMDLRGLNHIALDVQRQSARVGAGVLAGALCAACDPHGLMPVVGVHPDVGVAGLTLGGGLGLFLGRHGASCDNLLSARLLDAKGRLHHVSPQSDPELFWGLRGGGGNFGIVTEFEFRLHPVRQLLGGLIAYRGVELETVLQAYETRMRDAPDELVVELSVIGLGKPVVVAVVCWCGELAEGQRQLQRWRELPGLWVDSVEPVTHAELRSRIDLGALLARVGLAGLLRAPASAAGAPPQNIWRGGSMPGLGAEAITVFAEAAARAGDTWTIGLSHHLHGQVCRVGVDESPMPRPQGRLSYLFGRQWRHERQQAAALEWLDESMAAAAPHAGAGSYVNFLSCNDESAVRAAYGDSYARLAALKQRMDPDNLFHRNRNIRPLAAGGIWEQRP